MGTFIQQPLSVAVNTAAFAVLDYSDTLNNLASRITGGRIDRNTLAESVIHQASDLAFDIAREREDVNAYAQSIFGLDGSELIDHAKHVFISDDQSVFSASVRELVTSASAKYAAAGDGMSNDIVAMSPEFATKMIENYVGKQAVHQILGEYAEHYNWDEITDRAQAYVADKESSSFKDILLRAGVRMASNLAHRLVMRGIVENRSTSAGTLDENAAVNGVSHAANSPIVGAGVSDATSADAVSPEIRLAAGCLHAYLSNETTCKDVLETYQPTQSFLNPDFIDHVTTVAVALAERSLVDAEIEIKRADQAHQDAVNAGASASALDAAGKSINNAKKGYIAANRNVEMSKAIRAILLTDSAVSDEERVSQALRTFLASIPLSSAIVSLLSRTLVADNGLPAQNIVGTYAKRYGWDALENLLLDAVQKQTTTTSDSNADKRSESTGEENDGWAQAPLSQFALKLAVAHLRTYIEHGNFDKSDSPEYSSLVELIHENKELVNEDMSSIGVGLQSLPVIRNYINSKLENAANSLSQAAAKNSGLTAYALQASAAAATAMQAINAQSPDYVASAVKVAEAVGTDIQDYGLIGALQSATMKATVSTAGYASNAAVNFASSTRNLFKGMVSGLKVRPIMVA